MIEAESTAPRPHSGDPGFIEGVLARSMDLRGQGDLVSTMAVALAAEIVEGTLRAGQELTSVELGRRFGTSRTPVRDALALLQREGLVEVEPRRRARVAGLTLAETRDLYAIRSSLYALVSDTIARDGDPAALALLDQPLAAMRAALDADDSLGYFHGTVEFREVEASICPNRQVGQLIDSLGLRVYRLRRFGLSVPGRPEKSYRDYVRMVEAYHEGDARMARAVSHALMARALTTIEENWELFAAR